MSDLNAQLAIIGSSDPALTATINAHIMQLESDIQELERFIGTFPL